MLFKLGAKTGDELHHVGFHRKQFRIVAEHQTDALGFGFGQRLRRPIGLPAQFMGDFQHFGTGVLGNPGFAVQCIRDRTAGDSGSLGDIENRHLTFLHGHADASFFIFELKRLLKLFFSYHTAKAPPDLRI